MNARLPNKEKIKAKLDVIQSQRCLLEDLGDFDKFVMEVSDYLDKMGD